MTIDTGKCFHESYFEHSCAVVEVKDVLVTDIPGRSNLDQFRRWWFGLFLLSYSDERARVYYTSSHAMRMERTLQFRNFRNRIHPLSKFRNFWEAFMLTIVLLNKITFNHNTSLTYGQTFLSFYYLGVFTELAIIFDVYFNLQTGYIDYEARKVVLEKYEGLLHYGSNKLFIHVASSIPLQCIMFLRYGSNISCALCKTNSFIVTLNVLSVFSLIRVYEFSNLLTRERSNYKLTHFLKFSRIVVLGIITMLQYVALIDLISLLSMVASDHLDITAFVTKLIRLKFVNPDPPSDSKFFIANFSRVCKSIALFGFSFYRTQHSLDVTVSLIAYLIGIFFYMWLVLECFNFISRIYYYDDVGISKKIAMDNMVRCRQLPDTVTKKLWKYYDFKYSRLKLIEQENSLYTSLPNVLKRDAFVISYMHFITKIPYFNAWPPHILEEIVLLLKVDIYLNNDMVAEPWVQSEGLFVVALGELVVYHRGVTESGHLIDGDYFGELSLVTDKEMRSSSVFAISPSVVLLLEKSAFRMFMRQYADLFLVLKQALKKRFNSTTTEE